MYLKNLTQISKYIRETMNSKDIKTSDPRYQNALLFLIALSKEIRMIIPSDTLENLQVITSKGSGAAPKVLWISILPRLMRVSDSLSVTICCARSGSGCVSGVMTPTAKRFGLETVQRSKQNNYLDINGGSSKTRYNDLFVNPKEFFFNDFRDQDFTQHILESVQLMTKIRSQLH